MYDQFSQEELQLLNFRLGLENNAMLRIVLANQVKIMEKLNIPMDVSEDVYNDLLPGESYNEKSVASMFYKAVGPITGMLQKRAYEWVHMNEAAVRSEENKSD